MQIKVLEAFNGDCLIVSFIHNGQTKNILIDGGITRTYTRYLKPALEKISANDQFIDLLVVTHIDDDHIGGIKEFYQDTKIDRSFVRRVWFNSGRLLSAHFNTPLDEAREVKLIPNDTVDMSIRKGITLEKILLNEGWKPELIMATASVPLFDASITILSPDEGGLGKLNDSWQIEIEKAVDMSSKYTLDYSLSIEELAKREFSEDSSIPNGSSIAFLIEQNSKKYLSLADSHPSVIVKSLNSIGHNVDNKLEVDAVKIAHHASKANTNDELLAIVKSKKFIVCNDGSRHGLPNKEALVRILLANPGCTFYFNYKEIGKKIFSVKEQEKYNFQCKYLSDMNNTLIL